MQNKNLPRLAAALLLAAALSPNARAATPPAKILVEDFTAAPGIVQLDPSPGVQRQRQAEGISAPQAAAQDTADVQNALAETLVQKFQAMGLKAERVPAGTVPGPGELAVTGQITAIQEGNRARRTMVGLGAGKAEVEGNATLVRGTTSGPQVLQSYSTSANSGRMPGLGIGAAANGVKSAGTAISAGTHGASEIAKTPVADQAVTVANKLSASLGQYFAAQGWIAAP